MSPLEFLPMLLTPWKSEDRLVVHEVCSRVPAFSQKSDGLDRETSVLKFNLLPARFPYGLRLTGHSGGQQQTTAFLIRFGVSQEFKRVQKSSLFPSGSITRKSRILPSKSSGGDCAFIPMAVISA